ncbi:MAG TPA: ABC transporter permease [Clostridiales bacterium]|nr:ABC transporter permease [Clostridiales bacterium]
MKKSFYPKLAITNIRKNARTVVPFIITCILTIMMFFMMSSLCQNTGLNSMESGSQSLIVVLQLGTIVIGIFSVIFLFYTYSFLMKRRKKEFGLYNILGMDKKHIAKVISFETLFIGVFSMIVGLLGGVLFNKLIYMALIKLMHFNASFDFQLTSEPVVNTVILFTIIFILMLLNTLRQVHVSKPIELLRGGNTGEKEPKTKWVLAIVGLLCLGCGYYISLTTINPLQAMMLFFVAVILVIIGTYCLFTAGSIAILKLLRKNKNYYYKTKNFVSVSGMIYRMKQNAVGLANICILATMVLVMLSSTVSLYIGSEEVLNKMYPYDCSITTQGTVSDDIYNTKLKIANKALRDNNVTSSEPYRVRELGAYGVRSNNSFESKDLTDAYSADCAAIIVMPVSDYNNINGTNAALNDDQVLTYSSKTGYTGDTFTIDNTTFNVKEKLTHFEEISYLASQMMDTTYVIVKDISIFNQITGNNNTNGEVVIPDDKLKQYNMEQVFSFNMDGATTEEVNAVQKQIYNDYMDLDCGGYLSFKETSKADFYTIYGGLFFVGIFLGTLFIMATVLIIYYKQISEGYDDKERFKIMQKVGMSKHEIKKSINSQVLVVFFLPLIVAIIHIAFAFPVITRLLSVLALTNTVLYIICTIVSIVIFAVIYAIVYALTSKVYYKIVE